MMICGIEYKEMFHDMKEWTSFIKTPRNQEYEIYLSENYNTLIINFEFNFYKLYKGCVGNMKFAKALSDDITTHPGGYVILIVGSDQKIREKLDEKYKEADFRLKKTKSDLLLWRTASIREETINSLLDDWEF